MRALVLALLLTAVAAPAADAATFAVTKTADTNDGVCDLDCSLREAILAAKLVTPGEPDTITLGPGVHDNTAADFVLAIGEQLTITGAGARTTTIRELSGGDGRVFLVEQDARLTISDATVTGAQVSNGVLVTSGATLEATRMTFSGNSAPGGGRRDREQRRLGHGRRRAPSPGTGQASRAAGSTRAGAPRACRS